eukprot:gene27175-33447_t
MQAHGLQLDVYAYTMQVDLWCRQGDIESASATLEEMKLQGVHPNVVTYTALVKGHLPLASRAGILAKILGILK